MVNNTVGRSDPPAEYNIERNIQMKKFRRSPVAIACYVLAAVFAAYFVSVVIVTISTITEYYAAYGMSAGAGEVLEYLFQQGLTPLTSAILTFMAGFILEAVRKLDPANWMTDEELAEAKEAKRMAKEAKQIAKGEAAKAAAEAAAGETAAEEGDAAGSEDAGEEAVSADFAAVVADEAEDTVVFEETVSEADPQELIEETADIENEATEVLEEIRED